jgi:hypothetical protein
MLNRVPGADRRSHCFDRAALMETFGSGSPRRPGSEIRAQLRSLFSAADLLLC